MARSLIGGLVATGMSNKDISVSEPKADLRETLTKDFGVNALEENASAVMGANVIVLAVKPQILQEVVTPLGSLVAEARPLLISVAAGVTCSSIERWVGSQPALIRVMPNTPALIGAGISALYANNNVSDGQSTLAEKIMAAVGKTVWIEEETLMDAVTAASGSGPAYFLYFLHAIHDSSV